jgi:hypothetical protein
VRLRLFNLAAALSLALCMATAALWVLSYWTWDEVYRETVDLAGYKQRSLQLVWWDGNIIFAHTRFQPAADPSGGW